jgi:hypothetical protein
MKSCFLKGYGLCSESISREHYVSETVLATLGSDRKVRVGGLPWQPADTLKTVGVSSLQSKILYAKHNSELTKLDSTAGEFFRALTVINRDATKLPPLTQFDDPLLERWFAKVLCGITVAAGFGNGTLPDEWKKILLGNGWPEFCGLYFASPTTPVVLAREFFVGTWVHPQTRTMFAAEFRVTGLVCRIALERPDSPERFGTFRPRGIIFRLPTCERRLEFVWPSPNNRAIVFTTDGKTTDRPPQFEGWKNEVATRDQGA